MSRRKVVSRREILPDPKYGDQKLAKFINQLMSKGKKSLAESIVYGALGIVSERLRLDPVKVFYTALANIAPGVEVRSRRVGGATYQIPVEVPVPRRETLSMRWLVKHARARREKSMELRLAAEIMDAYEGRGRAVRQREDVHRMAEANRAFAHYRF